MLGHLPNAQADLNLRWTHMTEGMFSDVLADKMKQKQASLNLIDFKTKILPIAYQDAYSTFALLNLIVLHLIQMMHKLTPHEKLNKMDIRQEKTQIRLGGSKGWSEFSLGENAILMVLSWGGWYM